MTSFIQEANFFEGNNPENIAAQYGTPLYVYNEKILRDRMAKVAKVITKYPLRFAKDIFRLQKSYSKIKKEVSAFG